MDNKLIDFDKYRILVIVPAYNEKDSIAGVIDDIKGFNDKLDIVVINDGSRDNTGEIVRSTGKADVIDLVLNLGIGGAVQTGFIYADINNYDIALQFDGDGQHIASEIPNIVEPIINGEADFTIGSRFAEKHGGWKSSIARRMGIWIFKVLNSLIIRQRVTDNTSGFRAYNKEAIKYLAKNYPQDYPEPETVIIMGKNGFKIKEVFAKMRERTGGTSSISIIDGVYYMIKVILAVLISAIRPKGK